MSSGKPSSRGALPIKLGLSLSEHALTKEDGTEILCLTEEEVYNPLGLPWIAPELREEIVGIAEVRDGRSFCLSLPLDLPGGNSVNPKRHPPKFGPVFESGDLYFNYTGAVADDLTPGGGFQGGAPRRSVPPHHLVGDPHGLLVPAEPGAFRAPRALLGEP